MFSVVIIERDDSSIGTKVRTIDNIFPLYDKECRTIEFIKDNHIVETFRLENIGCINIHITSED
jgi:hypothetical protein